MAPNWRHRDLLYPHERPRVPGPRTRPCRRTPVKESRRGVSRPPLPKSGPKRCHGRKDTQQTGSNLDLTIFLYDYVSSKHTPRKMEKRTHDVIETKGWVFHRSHSRPHCHAQGGDVADLLAQSGRDNLADARRGSLGLPLHDAPRRPHRVPPCGPVGGLETEEQSTVDSQQLTVTRHNKRLISHKRQWTKNRGLRTKDNPQPTTNDPQPTKPN